ncbi:MAG: helix-turn-helix domain-containing protein [Oscillospiraceae bacterium]|nr:helix-turn-helix domain-containing protein [Oscillospiraceae bacterium]
MNEMACTIGERIRAYRTRAGMTQMKLAERAGVHHTYIGQLERGEKNASLETIEKVARALNLPFETLFEALVDGNANNDIAREIYELITAQPEREQLALLNLLKGMVAYKQS